jgi:hypothetical protein
VVTAKYSIVDSVVTVKVPQLVGTLTGEYTHIRTIPAAIRPQSYTRAVAVPVTDNDTRCVGSVVCYHSTGTWGIYPAYGLFFEAGTGGLGLDGVSFTYDLR